LGYEGAREAAAGAAAAGAEDEAVAPKQQQRQAAAEMAAVLYFNLNYEGNHARVLAEWLRFQLLQVATPIWHPACTRCHPTSNWN
jgi:hypothetical protein